MSLVPDFRLLLVEYHNEEDASRLEQRAKHVVDVWMRLSEQEKKLLEDEEHEDLVSEE